VMPVPIPKTAAARSRHYLDFVREHDCCVPNCRGRSQAAHIGAHGLGVKASDFEAVPCCAAHHIGHQGLHHMGRVRFEQAYRVNFSTVIAELKTEYLGRYPSRLFSEPVSTWTEPTVRAGDSIQETVRRVERSAWEALGLGNFSLFAHHAGEHRNLNRLLPEPVPDPFETVRALGRAMSGTERAA